jgi:hypothetical protein
MQATAAMGSLVRDITSMLKTQVIICISDINSTFACKVEPLAGSARRRALAPETFQPRSPTVIERDPGSMPTAIARSFSACTCHPVSPAMARFLLGLEGPFGQTRPPEARRFGSRSRSLCAGRLSAGSRVANSVRRRQRSPLERICDSPRWKRRRPTVLGLQSLLIGLRRRVDHRRGQRVQRPEPRGLKPLSDTVGKCRARLPYGP